jgi:hypothetical protein
MANTEKIVHPTFGINELGTETNDTHLGSGISAGTDTQLHLAAKGGHKHKKNINNDEKVVKNQNGEDEFLKSDETDE